LSHTSLICWWSSAFRVGFGWGIATWAHGYSRAGYWCPDCILIRWPGACRGVHE